MAKYLAAPILATALLAGTAPAAESPKLAPETIKKAMESYIAAINAKDLAAVVALYDDNATVEDPAGSSPRTGRQAIRDFYETVIKRTGASKLELVTVNPSTSDSGAMLFQIKANQTVINVIDVMRFNTDGKITGMKAYVAFAPAK